MRNFLLVLLVITIAAITNAQSLNLINKQDLSFWVEALSHDSMMGRFTGTDETHDAAKFIANEMQHAGLRKVAGFDDFFDDFIIEDNGNSFPATNVIGAIAGQSDKVIIYCAHYDHIGTTANLSSGDLFRRIVSGRSNSDSIFNGANDNASGVAALLALARYFADTAKPLHTILFIAFSAEELGLVGARKLAAEFEPQKVLQVINLEMLGRSISATKRRPFVTSEKDQRFLKLLNGNYQKATTLKNYFAHDSFYGEHLFDRSDNKAFSEKNIPSNTIMASAPTDKYYHDVDDEWETLDFENMETVVRAIALATAPIVFGN